MNCSSASIRLRYYGLAFRVFAHIRVNPSIERQVVPTGNGSATLVDNMRDTTEATWKQLAHTVGLRVVARAALDTTVHSLLSALDVRSFLSPDLQS